jgi:16S rRNA (cytosine967-C5)-methyltransferase
MAQPLPTTALSDARQLAFWALRAVHRGAYADVALHRHLAQAELSSRDRSLVTELVYGSVRRQRTLDALLDHLGNRPAAQQAPDLRVVLHLGLYQLRYLDHIPPSAGVNTSVDLAKKVGLKGLAKVVNGLLRQYLRQAEQADPLPLPADPVAQLGVIHSYPDWLVQLWVDELGLEAAAQLGDWFNQPPSIDLRVNPLRTDRDTVLAALKADNILARPLATPQGIRLIGAAGAIPQLPGYDQGWWTVQDGSAQLVAALVDPQPGEAVIDACAAPGGKTTHLGELMQNQGHLWGCDRTASRLKTIHRNAQRIGLTCIQTRAADSRNCPDWVNQADRVLVDAPCSGLGTLHRHADARWRQTPATIAELSQLQAELLAHTATWVKPGGILVYATCTLHPQENERQIEGFLADHPYWQLVQPPESFPVQPKPGESWLKLWPHQAHQDGFFIAKLQRQG